MKALVRASVSSYSWPRLPIPYYPSTYLITCKYRLQAPSAGFEGFCHCFGDSLTLYLRERPQLHPSSQRGAAQILSNHVFLARTRNYILPPPRQNNKSTHKIRLQNPTLRSLQIQHTSMSAEPATLQWSPPNSMDSHERRRPRRSLQAEDLRTR